MWEEQPGHQKLQARIIGVLLGGLLVLYVGWSLVGHDWGLLKQVLLMAAAVVIVLGLLPGGMWLLLRLVARTPAGGMKRFRPIATILSAIGCGVLVILLPVSDGLAVWDASKRNLAPVNYVALTPRFNVRFMRGDIWFSSDATPYIGSIRMLSDEKGGLYGGAGHHMHAVVDWTWHIAGQSGFMQESYIGEHNELVERDRMGDLPGVYWRDFWMRTEAHGYWTLAISLWYPILLLAVLPGWWAGEHGWIWRKRPPVKE